MSIKTKINIIFCIFILSIILIGVKSYAVSISVSPSKSTVSPGQSFSVTISGNDATGKVNISVSGGSASTSSVWIENNSQTITVTAGASGTVKISASGELSSNAGEDKNVSSSASVKIQAASSGGNTSGGSQNNNNTTKKPTTTKPVEEKEKSKDSSLKELAIAEGAITPEFNKDVKEYALTVPNEITSVSVTATPTDSKAKAVVEGNTELKEGENTVTVTVTAENGDKTNYTIKVTRSRAKLSLQSLVIKYENENKELIENPLNPDFKFDVTEYSLQELQYWVKSLNIDAKANLEGATIDIKGADNLQTGENTITITLKIAQEGEVPEGEEPKEETITYTIKVNKEIEPTILGKILNKFKAIFGGVTTWYNNNQEKVILGSLGICIIALIGLSIYIVVDYNKYKDVISKVKKVKEINEINNERNIVEEINNNTETTLEVNEEDIKNNKGKHF
jgi:hypothetical protein